MDKIYDSIFRTLSERNTRLLIPLINEVFNENYDIKDEIQLISDNHHIISEELSEKITDSCIKLGKKLYHLECQSNPDGTMAVRMIEYDFLIALENAEKTGEGYTMSLPSSAVLYLRHTESTPDSLDMKLKFPDGSSHMYSVPIIKVKKYNIQEMLDKKLYFLIPYYQMRYEESKDETEMDAMANDYQMLYNGLIQAHKDDYVDMNDIFNIMYATIRLVDRLFPNSKTKQEVEKMRGELWTTEADILYDKGQNEGKKSSLILLYKDGVITSDVAAGYLNISKEEFEKIASNS